MFSKKIQVRTDAQNSGPQVRTPRAARAGRRENRGERGIFERQRHYDARHLPVSAPLALMDLVSRAVGAGGEVALAQVAGGRINGRSGNSDSWQLYRRNVASIFERFRDEKRRDVGVLLGATRGATRGLISEGHATDRELWELFATWLFQEYKIPAGKRGAGDGVAIDTAQNYLKCAINLARDVWPKADFFKCLDKEEDQRRNEDRVWYLNLRENMWKCFFARAVENGEKIDESAPEIGLVHVEAMVEAYARYATANALNPRARDGHARKFSILSLWHVAGRSGEIGFLSYKKLDWDEELQCVHVEVAQMKTTKTKRLVFSAGANRHICWFTALGDRLATESRAATWFETNEEYHWLFPDLTGTMTPGHRIGEYMKALVPVKGGEAGPSNKRKEFVDYVVESLPENVSAASIRTGAANKLHMHMPEEFACTTTGHHLQSTAHQQYINATTANCMPGAVVLAGFPAFGWGQSGECAKPPSLRALDDQFLIQGVTFDKIIDELYRVSSYSPEVLQVNGRLRQAVRAAFACQVMYYEERHKARECSDVTLAMRQVLMDVKLVDNQQAAHGILVQWGHLLRGQFDGENMRLTMRETASQQEQTVLAIAKLRNEIEASRVETARLVAEVATMKSGMTQLAESMASVGGAFNELSKMVTARVTGVAARAGPEALVADAAGEDGLRADESAAVPGAEMAVAAPQVGVVSPRGAGAGAAAQPSALDVLMAHAGAAEAPVGTAGMQARELVQRAWVGNGKGCRVEATLAKQAKRNAMLALEVYNAVMTPYEKTSLNRSASGQRRQEVLAEGSAIVNAVENRVVEMLKEWYNELGKEPRAFLFPPKDKRTKRTKRSDGTSGPAAAARQPLMVHSMDLLKRDLTTKFGAQEAQDWAKRTRSRAVETEGGEPAAALPAPEEREVEQPAGSPGSPWARWLSFGKRE
jgi:hypothetical protein